MADEQDRKELDGTQSEDRQQTTGGQQSHRSEYGQQGAQTERSDGQPIGGNDSQTGSGTPLSQGAEPPRSMGTRGSEFGEFGDQDGSRQQGQSGMGQSDLGTQADTTLAGRDDQQDLGQDQPGSVGGASGQQREGFIGSQGGGGSEEYLRSGEGPSSADATGGTDFANQGRGAQEDRNEDDEGSA